VQIVLGADRRLPFALHEWSKLSRFFEDDEFIKTNDNDEMVEMHGEIDNRSF